MNFPFDYVHYRKLLEALAANRRFVTFPERRSAGGPACLMRHDIDFGLEFLGVMPAIERDHGISATYFIQVCSDFYNPFSLSQAAVIDKILSMGHRLGLHSIEPRDVPGAKIADLVEKQISLLRSAFGEVDAVSFHQPSEAILSNAVRISYINTYDHEDMRGYLYMSDSCGQWAIGNPVEHVETHRDASFHVLTHPALWGEREETFPDISKKSILTKTQYLYNYCLVNGRGIDEPLECVFVKKAKTEIA